MSDNESKAVGPSDQDKKQFSITRMYLKDLSFESPDPLKVFDQADKWLPEMNLDIGTHTKNVADEAHEVELTLTVTVKSQEVNAFVVEVKYAGIFLLKGFELEETKQMLGSYCPSIIYPYAREVVSDAVSRGGFPQLILAPVNFDALYAKHLEQEKVANAGAQNVSAVE